MVSDLTLDPAFFTLSLFTGHISDIYCILATTGSVLRQMWMLSWVNVATVVIVMI